MNDYKTLKSEIQKLINAFEVAADADCVISFTNGRIYFTAEEIENAFAARRAFATDLKAAMPERQLGKLNAGRAWKLDTSSKVRCGFKIALTDKELSDIILNK